MYLKKATKEKTDFIDLIDKEVTFASDIVSISGRITNNKGDSAIICDVEYTSGYWSKLCPDIYIQPKISSFRLKGVIGVSWLPDTFIEYKKR